MRLRLRTAAWLLRNQARRGPRAVGRAVRRLIARAFGKDDALDVYRPILRPIGRRGLLLGRAHSSVVIEARFKVLTGMWQPERRMREQFSPLPGRVLHVVGKSLPYSIAGYTVRTHHIATAQVAAGIDAHVVSRFGFPWSIGDEASSTEERIDGVPYHRLGSKRQPTLADEHMTASLDALRGLVEELRPSLLHAHSDFHNGLLALALREDYGIPVVYEARGFWEETWLSKSPERAVTDDLYRFRREREVDCLRRADHVTTLAQTMRDRIAGDGVDPEDITVVPNAVDPSAFPVVGGSRNLAVTRSLGIPDTAPTVGYVSSLVGYEGIDTLVRAIADLRDRGSDVHAFIVGDGEERANLEALAADLDLGDRLVFVGRVPPADVRKFYEAIDVFVIPRRDLRVTRLVQPLKPFEALSSGLPLVVSDIPALAEIVHRSGGGLVFEPEDPGSLADRISELSGDPDRRAALGASGAEWVRAHHTWSSNAERYRAVYAALGVFQPGPAA